MGSIAPSSGALLSSRSYSLSDGVYKVRRALFPSALDAVFLCNTVYFVNPSF